MYSYTVCPLRHTNGEVLLEDQNFMIMNKICRYFILPFLTTLFFQFPLMAQVTELNDNGARHYIIETTGAPEDFQVPLNPPYNTINFEILGASGGWSKIGSCKSNGGLGATTTVTIAIGTGPGKIAPGDYVRFIIGVAGEANTLTGTLGTGFACGGGGGGTAVLISRDQVDWEILAVAGGGGGAYQGAVFTGCVDSQNGQGGRKTTEGGDGEGSNSGDGGINGNGGEGGGTNGTGDLSGGGGGAFSNGGGNFDREGRAGFPNGGAGGTLPNSSFGVNGSWGFGGGGAGEDAGGGGGGYSGGGGGGELNNGGGGGSYTNPEYVIDPEIIAGGATDIRFDGSLSYQFKNICIPNITGISYINPLCAADDQGRIQLDYTLTGGSNCGSQLEWSLEPINGWGHLGDGVFRSMRAGTYTASVKNTSIDAVVATYTFTVGVTNESPKAICKNITVDLTNGTYSNVGLADLIDGGSTGPCDPVLTASKTSFDCSNLGNNTVTLTVKTSNNRSSSCQANVQVQLSSSEQAVARCKVNPSFNLDGGTVVLSADDIDNGSSIGGCATGMSVSPSTFDCTKLGANIVTLTVGSGQNVASCTSTITITDNNTPTANCKSTASAILVDGSASIDYTVIDNGSLSNNCTQLSYDISQSDFDCSHVGANQVTLTVTDDRNNQSTCTATVNVIDNTNPVAVCQDVEVALDENGSYILDPADLDDGSTDQCDLTFIASQTIFNCEDIGIQDITLTATDPQGNESSCTAQVTVIDDIAPVANCFDLTLQLRSGIATYAAYKTQIFQTTSDNCEVSSIAFLNDTKLTCEDIGINEHAIEMFDASGNRGTCSFLVTVVDEQSPTAVCQDLTIALDDTGNGSISPAQIDNGSRDDCGIATLNLDQTTFTCDQTGDNTVTLSVTDINGNLNTCEATVTVLDGIAPVVFCQNLTLQLSEEGVASISPADIDGGSDACGIASLNLDKTEFSCDELGNNTVTLTATDGNGNTSNCQATVEVVDQTGPTLDCDDYEIALDENGTVEISALDLLDEPFDACGIAKYEVSQTSFSCQDLGVQQVMVTVTDNNGNSSSCQAAVHVRDEIKPSAICQDVTIQLGTEGTASLSPQQVDGGSFDNCSIQDLSLDQSQFDCSNIGENTVTLYVEDRGDNLRSCQATVTVEDNTGPTAICKDLTINLDENGFIGIDIEQVGAGSYDNCSEIQLGLGSLSQTKFTCEDLGTNIVTMTISDAAGNTSDCEATITVRDKIAPSLTCPQNMTVSIDQGECGAYVTLPKAVASDNCGLKSLLSRYRPIDENEDPIGEDSAWSDDHSGFFELGSYEIQWEAADGTNSYSYCVMILDVIDQEAPEVICKDVTVQLDENGEASITEADIDNGSSDACGIATMSLDQSSFTCDQTGENTVTLSVIDNSQNSSNCQATVTVVDEIDPTLTCPQDLTVSTDQGECGAYITLPKAAPADNCGIKNLKSRYRVVDEQGDPVGSWSTWASDHSGFFELGSYQIQWRAKDDSNNKGFCSFQLDIIDQEAPEVICKDVTINFNGEETIAITSSSIFDEAVSFDACGRVSFVSQSLSEVSCENVGETLSVQVIGVDPNGNNNNCTAQVTVVGLPCGFEATDIDCEQGAAAEYDPAENVFTLGADDCSGYPQGEFSYVGTELCGDGEITVRVSDLIGDGRAGVVMMESTDPGSRRVSMLKSQTRQVTTEYRASTNGNLRQKHKNRSGVEWVKIVKIGTKFKTYTSTNGSYWKHAHTINFSNFADCVYAGIMTYSRRSYDPVTATFDQLSIISYSNTAREALPTGASVALEQVSEQSRADDFQGHPLSLAVAPNPFSDQTRIEFNLQTTAEVTLEIYNLHGQRVHSLENAQLDAGTHRYQWDGNSSKGESLPTGIYMLRLRADMKWVTTKVSLINR